MQENTKGKIFLDGDLPESEEGSESEECQNDNNKNISRDIAALVIQMGEDPEIKNEQLQFIYEKLQEIYAAGNRHSYSVLSSTIREEIETNEKYSIQALKENMGMFSQIMQKNAPKTNEKVKMSFEKLYDHVMLECDRNLYIYKIKDEISEKQNELSKQQKSILEKQDEVTDQVASTIKDIRKLYADLIGIISIFVAIFALITVNANISFKLTTYNMNEIFKGIIIINLVVVVCIVVLLGAVRLLIINNLTKTNPKPKNKSRRN